MKVLVQVLFVLVFHLASLPLDAESAEKLQKTRVGYGVITLNNVPWWIAQDRGLFRDEGLDGEVLFVRGSPTVIKSLLAGEIQAGYSGIPAMAPAIAGGAGLVAVALPSNRLDNLLVSREPVKDPKSLRGKKFAVSSLGGSSEAATRIALEQLGVDPNSITVVQVGGSRERSLALSKGSVDVALLAKTEYLSDPELQSYHLVYDLTKSNYEFGFTALVVTREFATERRKNVLGIIKAFYRGIWYLQKNKDDALKVAATHLRNPDIELLRKQWHHVAFDYFQPIPYPTEAGIMNAVKVVVQRTPKASTLKASDVSDPSFVEELVKTGFFKQSKEVK